MGKGKFTEDFKLDAIKHFKECGYSVADVPKRLGVSIHSLCGWINRHAASPALAVNDESVRGDQASEAGAGSRARGP